MPRPLYDSVTDAIRHTIDRPLDSARKQELVIWTAPATARCGQMCVLYEASRYGGRGAWIAFGRLCSDALRAYEGNRKSWAYIQWRQVGAPVPYRVARDEFGMSSVQGSHSFLDRRRFLALAKRMVRGDHASRTVLERWQAGRAFPSSDRLDLHDLVRASRDFTDVERDLYPPIREVLEAQGWRELPPEVSEVVRALRGGTPTDPTAHVRRTPDIPVCRPRSKRLLLVEVKRDARKTLDDFDPVGQLLSYVATALADLRKSRLSGWTVEPLLVAERFSREVLEEAGRAKVPGGSLGVPCQQFADNQLLTVSS